MKTLLLGAAMLASFTTAAAAASPNTSGHWEWRVPPGFGPNKSVPIARRVWVADIAATTTATATAMGCDCAMMRGDAAGCMKHSKHTAS